MADSPPRFSMQMRGDRDKSRATGAVPDPLPVQCSVPSRDFMPSEHEQMMMAGSTKFKRRTRKPSVDLARNPACEERQLTDAYELMRVNRNPALYRPTKADAARSAALSDQMATNMANADVMSLKLKVLESIGADEAATQVRRSLHAGSLQRPSVDPNGLEASNLPHFLAYTRQDPGREVGAHEPTYGHAHHPRIFNPVSHDLTRKGRKAHSAPGMTIAQLQGLLKPPQPSGGRSGRAVGDRKQLGGASLSSGSVAGSAGVSTYGSATLDDLDYSSHGAGMDGLAHGSGLKLVLGPWDNSFATPASVKDVRDPLPAAGGSLIMRDHALSVPFREKMGRTAAAAAGSLLQSHEIGFDRQAQDRFDMSLLGTGVTRKQGALDAELSPRREYQRDAVRAILRERKLRDAAAAARVATHSRAEAIGRIPRPTGLVPVNGPARQWDPSPLLGESPY